MYYRPISQSFYPVSEKTVVRLIFCNLKKLEPILIIFGTLYAEGRSFQMHAYLPSSP